METNQPKKTDSKDLQMRVSNKSLLEILDKGDKIEVSMHLSQFKEQGIVKFENILLIPSAERLPAITATREGRNRVFVAIAASIRSALSNLNLRYGLNDDQIIELSDQIIDQSHEDNLSLEDVLLFLQQLITGKAGKIYDRLDIPTFFELFETYREDRHKALKNIQYERHVNNKSLGPNDRASDEKDDRDAHREALADHLKKTYKPRDGKE